MKVLVTGANGFIGKNLCLQLKTQGFDVLPYDLHTEQALADLVAECDFIMHLAGVNRPELEEEYYTGNVAFTKKLIDTIGNRSLPLLLSSSRQAELDNPYGNSKKQAEELVFAYGKRQQAPVYVYRLDNAFGKWCKPNYNSVIATFCHNIASGEEIVIHDASVERDFVYIDDIVKAFIGCINQEGSNEILQVTPVYRKSIGEVARSILSFDNSRLTKYVPFKDAFEEKLYATYLSYLPEDQFSYPLKTNVDERGSFTEFLKTQTNGQVSVNIQHPGITKGNHWHHTKNEKFLVVSGEALIQFRKLGDTKVIEYRVSEKKLEVIDIPVGYTHNIINTGKKDLVTIMWASEVFDAEHPDTFYEEV
ncbi:MAG: NAD-dependent epimerase/dehydratase family protein [Solobacterium sp.]|nr:NAD-dependent epimerase/dehydratase family protein [Solobacterium sp.]